MSRLALELTTLMNLGPTLLLISEQLALGYWFRRALTNTFSSSSQREQVLVVDGVQRTRLASNWSPFGTDDSLPPDQTNLR